MGAEWRFHVTRVDYCGDMIDQAAEPLLAFRQARQEPEILQRDRRYVGGIARQKQRFRRIVAGSRRPDVVGSLPGPARMAGAAITESQIVGRP